MLAKRCPSARVTAIDFWGERWEYSQGSCEKNARLEGVEGRTSFQRASASALPFEDGHFDAAVSNLVFHEVADAHDKKEVVKEALRVVKKGGKFAFQDLFMTKSVYGDSDDLVKAIRGWGIKEVELIKTADESFVPGALKASFMLGSLATIRGEK